MAQPIILDDGDRWTVQVASSTESLERDQAALRQRINLAKVIVSSFAILGSLGIAIFTLRPLARLRRDVAARWTNNGDLTATNYPQEVQPLVSDINELLARNRDIVGRSRRQAADLAHALKTPSAILRNELEGLKKDGLAINDSLEALDRLDAQLARSFARMRAEQGSAAEYTLTDIDVSLGRMTRAFAAMAKNQDRTMRVSVDPNLNARINQDDFEEIIGNLLDNALKWSASAISLSAFAQDDTLKVFIEDDGPGIPTEDRDRVFSSGLRLDETKPGTGLGLAIACELSRAYSGALAILDSSDLGGAKFVVKLPLAVPQKRALV
jgi:signal transduction histidine kinase